MKEIENKEDFEKALLKKKKYFLWISKKEDLIQDFTIAEEIINISKNKNNAMMINQKEYSVGKDTMLREINQKIPLDFIAFNKWKIYQLTDKESEKYFKLILAKKISGKVLKYETVKI